ncbi:Ankyrin and HET domain protein [Metarhizium album ARSEF 1941]|uniref:Ankyrin and HET domain protein n=1 Tax=Metarhizium album (strain ARSEF 1941) TaxID=1081103 RepID=A0A0B2WFL7_METAS|nr:Ankyrin and HET domain protein [Metarhizium album ARSEF 1941]KHN94726.1 Ankyrin and HET domain protein [Metarhizium album ARSEF 1941]
MRDYQYQPLQPGEIRLLRLDATRSSQQPLSGQIIHHHLTNPKYQLSESGKGYLQHSLPYDAISYHWGGDTTASFEIIIRGEAGQETSIKVTSNLYTILRRLAWPDEARLLWADAICINQITSESNTEKGEQIQLMPDIYRVAACVQVYLGDEADNVQAALELLSSIADYSEHLDDSTHAYGEIGVHLAMQSGFILPPVQDKRWPALRAFFRRPWFRRVWVIQEFVYATDVCVICGDVEIDWHKLWLASKAYISNRQLMFHGFSQGLFMTGRLNDYREAHEGARSLHLVTDLRMRARGYMSGPYMVFNLDQGEPSDPSGLSIRKNLASIKGFENFTQDQWLSDRAAGQPFPYERHSLLDLLHRTSNFRATQSIDRLYALFGLAEDAAGYRPIYSSEQSLAVVSTQFASTFINNGHLPLILSTAGISSDKIDAQGWPSWVPDWTSVRYSHDSGPGLTRVALVSDEGTTRKKFQEEKERDAPRATAMASSNAQKTATVSETQNATAKTDGPGARQEMRNGMSTEARKDGCQKLYSAAGNTTAVFDADAKQGLLAVRATAVSLVKAVLPGKLLLPVNMYESMVSRLGNVYVTGEPMTEALWRTLVANRTIFGEPAPPEFALQYEKMKGHDQVLFVKAAVLLLAGCLVALLFVAVGMRHLPVLVQVGILSGLAWRQYIAVKPAVVIMVLLPFFRCIYVVLLVPLLVALAYYMCTHAYPVATLNLLTHMGVSTTTSTTGLPADCAAYASAVGLVANNRAFFWTADCLIGLVPLSTQENDIVVIVHGCDVPFVVRPSGREGCYRLVGECYVHGVMNGEMMTDVAKNSVDITLI